MIYEFAEWFDEYAKDIGDLPTPEQWAVILENAKKIYTATKIREMALKSMEDAKPISEAGLKGLQYMEKIDA